MGTWRDSGREESWTWWGVVESGGSGGEKSGKQQLPVGLLLPPDRMGAKQGARWKQAAQASEQRESRRQRIEGVVECDAPAEQSWWCVDCTVW